MQKLNVFIFAYKLYNLEKVRIRNNIIILLSLLAAACNVDKRDVESPVSTPVEVTIRATQGRATRAGVIQDPVIEVGADLASAEATSEATPLATLDTRTELGTASDSELPIHWSWSDEDKSGDQIMVWAEPATNAVDFTFAQTVFSLASFNYTYSSADFTATVAERMMEDYNYNYYAIYPVPTTTVNDTSVTYTLPTTQTGDYDGAYDIMRGSATGAALVERTGEDTAVWNEPELQMNHLLHLMRIRVPAGKNLMDRPIKRLEITFPEAIVGGTVTFNPTNPESDPEWSGQSEKLTIEFADDNLLDAAGRDVWFFVKPTTISGQIKFRAYGSDGVPSEAIYTDKLDGRELGAQHITPIALTIPNELEPVIVTFSCPDSDSYPNFLGEAATVMHIKSGPAALADKNTTITSLGNGVFGVRFYYIEGEVNTDLVGQTITVGFESAHADVSANTFDAKIVSMGADQDSRKGYYALPYLFFEDFTGINEYSYKRTAAQLAPAERPEGIDLSLHGLSKGWTGAHTGGDENNSAIRIFSRVDEVWGATRTYGRLDSPALSALTNETNVGLYFNYSGGRQDQNAYSPIAVVGYTTTEGAISARAAIEGNAKWEDISGYKTIPSISLSGDWNNITQEISCTIEKCKSNYRLSWQVYGTGGISGLLQIGNGIQWMFLDNIRGSVGNTAKHTGKNYRSFFPNHTN